MKKVAKSAKKASYPETRGSRLAAKARQMANKLTKDERAQLFREAMVVIYGGDSKETAGARR